MSPVLVTLEKIFGIETESSEASKVFERIERRCVRGKHRWTLEGKTEKESHTLWGGLNHVSGGSSSRFPLAYHLAFVWPWVHIWPDSPVCEHLLAKMDSIARVSGKLTGQIVVRRPCTLLNPEEPVYAHVVQELSLTSRMKNMWSLYLFIQAGLSSSLLLPSSLSWSICPRGTNSSCPVWDPPISCLKLAAASLPSFCSFIIAIWCGPEQLSRAFLSVS